MVEKIIKYIFIGGLFLLPFVFWPEAQVSYELPRVWFVLRWIEVLAVFGIIGAFGNTDTNKKDILLISLVCAFFVISLISSFLGVDLNKSLWGNYWRGDGLITLFHLVGLFFLLVLYWRDAWLKISSYSIAVGAVAVSILDIFGFTTFGQPNYLAGYLAVSLPFVIGQFTDKRIYRIIGALIILVAVIKTSALGALLSIAIYVLLYVLLRIGWSRRRVLLFIGIGLVPIVAFFWIQLQNQPFVAESRERLVIKGLLSVTERPLLGWGWANFDYAFDSVNWPIKLDKDVYADRAHSTLLEVLVATGVIGFVIYLWILGRLLQRLTSDHSSQILFLAVVVFIIHAQTNIISIAQEVIFWMILGIAAGSLRQEKQK